MTSQDAVVVYESKMSLTARDVKDQVQRIQEVMQAVMKDGEHYGKIPGCGPKPTLLKSGAEKLASTFRLAPDYPMADTIAIETDDLISYRVRCTLTHITTGQLVGSGVGACNSRERKYRNSQPWDIQNTIYKMACKRALVAAVLNATAASDCFTQDLEDMETPPASQGSASKPQPQRAESASDAKISDAQRKRLFAITAQAGIGNDEVKAYLQEHHGLTSTSDIKRSDYEAICDHFLAKMNQGKGA